MKPSCTYSDGLGLTHLKVKKITDKIDDIWAQNFLLRQFQQLHKKKGWFGPPIAGRCFALDKSEQQGAPIKQSIK